MVQGGALCSFRLCIDHQTDNVQVHSGDRGTHLWCISFPICSLLDEFLWHSFLSDMLHLMGIFFPLGGVPAGDAPAVDGVPAGDAPAVDAPAGDGVPAGDAPAGDGVPAGDAPAGDGVPAGDAPALEGF